MSQPRLVATRTPPRAEAVVLVLHGGDQRPEDPLVSPWQLSVLRMVPVAARIARAGRGRLAVHRVLNARRGWGTGRTPVDDARWAMDRVGERYGDLPVGLVGHSLGGRAALLAGQDPRVAAVVALNPWLHRADDADLAGRRVLLVHGTEDRVAEPERARAVADRLRRRADVEWREVPGAGHAMLRHRPVFERAAADFLTETLLPPGVR
ncbi:dienelactone hydrolase family protein [Nocardioides marmotae]|uniref:dienelactone hydrolase family protein n=1 Tax=Nocardioides marmotae TaxID=2663857 RepID=UPI00132C6EF9|nr:dienelactone hydrolase family protein [Nocardioides marmotae]MBC9734519.1 dienelactone hydrolase family protein [Nocardioides marmotae]MTB85620.1 alpha/beta hydrolase [Nocardioides marmotae]